MTVIIMAKKGTKPQTTMHKILHRELKIDHHERTKTGHELECSEMESGAFSFICIRPVTLINTRVKSNETGKYDLIGDKIYKYP